MREIPDPPEDGSDLPHVPQHIGGGTGDIPVRQELAMYRRAFGRQWDVTPEVRKAVLDRARYILNHSASERNQIAAGRLILAADLADATRERTAALERVGNVQAGSAALREMLRTPQGQAALESVSNAVLGLPAPAAPDAPPASAEPPTDPPPS